MKYRTLAIVIGVVFIAASCGGGTEIDDSSGGGGGGGGSASTTAAPDDACTGATLEATEVGIDATTITLAAIADTGSPIRPGLFQGSIDGMKAWADYRNANGGIACRQIVVKDYDSKLSPGDAKNAILSACTETLAMVGTTATFINDVAPMESCTDQAGAVTGIPDLAVLQTEPVHQCSKVSYVVLPTGGACPYSGSGERSYRVADGVFSFYLEQEADLHGVWVIPKDLPSTISSSMPGFRFSQELGIERDAEVGASGLDTQSAYTSIAQTIKDNGSTYARNGLDYKGTIFLRKEAQIQGVDSVKVWDCSVQCYDPRLITEGQAAVEDQYSWISFLPFEDRGANDTLDAFLQYDTKPDGFGAQAFAAGELFARVAEEIVAADGPNGLTRAAILEAVANIHDFDAGGMIPTTDIGAKTGSPCFVLMQVQGGKFTRVQPTKQGEFDCSGELGAITLDPLKAFQG